MHQSERITRRWFEFQQGEREGDFSPSPALGTAGDRATIQAGLLRSVEDRLRSGACCG
jgi:hypothetical protein